MSIVAREYLSAHIFLRKPLTFPGVVRLWLLGFGQLVVIHTPATSFAERSPP